MTSRVPGRALLLLGVGTLAALAYPLLVPGYLVTVGMLVLFTAFLGQAWNLAGGFAGQTSFGHVVFFGTGAYVSTILHVSYGWNPWLAWPVAVLAGGVVGCAIAVLAFRAGLRGSYFALITLAFAEVFRILANSLPITRGGLGMLIKADPRLENFQFKDPATAYYLALALCAAGGTFYAQRYLYIDPTIAFGVDKSVEMLLVTMVGGAGTVFGPLIGAAALTGINEITRALATVIPALKNVQPLSLVVYGVMLVIIVARLPDGLAGLFKKTTRHA